MDTNNFDTAIQPFFWVDHGTTASVCLTVGEYKPELFKSREAEGFEGSGYDWESLACVFLNEKAHDLNGLIKFDSEGSMFCAYSEDMGALKDFIMRFKAACEDETLIMDLFSRAELD